ncbi:MAG: hypothetical protein JW709_10575 [Sedimentisphaerales bacterium]|nr:hypothetical protein [Sedimentisphaerales bacterium]
MKPAIKYPLTVFVILVIVGGMTAIYFLFKGGPRSILAGFDKEMQRQYEQFAIGTPRKDVITLWEPPLRSSDTPCPPTGPTEGYQNAIDRARQSPAVNYDLWLNGVNWYYCLGFDEHNLLAFKTEGHD